MGSGEDAIGNQSSISIPRLLDKPDNGVLANSAIKSASAGRTMLRGCASHSCCLCKSNGSGLSGGVMAETIATLAFLSALAMLISSVFTKGKWLPGITVALLLMALIQSPLEGIHQPGGWALLIAASLCSVVQYHIKRGRNRKFFSGFAGGITLVLLLTMYPEEGIKETVNEYSATDGLIVIIESVIVGILLAQLLYNAVYFDKKNSIRVIAIVAILYVFSDIMFVDQIFILVISMCFVGLLPLLEDRITPKLGTGSGRAKSLAISTLLGIILVFSITYALVSGVNRVGSGDGAIAVSLWLTVAVTAIGMGGMLLPLFGFDAHPRPEAWGWRLGLSLSPILISIQTDLAGHLLLGITLAILISVSSPLVIEKGREKAV